MLVKEKEMQFFWYKHIFVFAKFNIYSFKEVFYMIMYNILLKACTLWIVTHLNEMYNAFIWTILG